MRHAPSVLALLVGACTVGPDYKAPAPPAVAGWRDPSARSGSAAAAISATTDPDSQWWSAFHDPVLSLVIGQAISGNLDLQQAVLRVVEARQNVVTARAAGLPGLNGQGSYTREQIGAKGILDSEGIYGKLNSLADQNSALNQHSPGAGSAVASAVGGALNGITQPINLYQYGLDASWELDLFGRVRRSVEQAQASTLAQAEATNDSLVMLEGQVASAYFQVRGAQALLASQQDNVAAAQQSLDLTRRQQIQGLATELDVDQARAQLDSNQQQLPGYEKQAQQAMNQLSVLAGQPPGSLDAMLRTPMPLPALPQLIGIGVPSTLARRRPDIREADRQCRRGRGQLLSGHLTDRESRHSCGGRELFDEMGEPFLFRGP